MTLNYDSRTLQKDEGGFACRKFFTGGALSSETEAAATQVDIESWIVGDELTTGCGKRIPIINLLASSQQRRVKIACQW